eukprot:COSAG05_NODE_124_length_17559_cov_8.898643_17_plen_194_part_00
MQPFGGAVRNLGIGGDRVRDIAWRVARGELDNLAPGCLVVLLVGTNDLDAALSDHHPQKAISRLAGQSRSSFIGLDTGVANSTAALATVLPYTAGEIEALAFDIAHRVAAKNGRVVLMGLFPRARGKHFWVNFAAREWQPWSLGADDHGVFGKEGASDDDDDDDDDNDDDDDDGDDDDDDDGDDGDDNDDEYE